MSFGNNLNSAAVQADSDLPWGQPIGRWGVLLTSHLHSASLMLRGEKLGQRIRTVVISTNTSKRLSSPDRTIPNYHSAMAHSAARPSNVVSASSHAGSYSWIHKVRTRTRTGRAA